MLEALCRRDAPRPGVHEEAAEEVLPSRGELWGEGKTPDGRVGPVGQGLAELRMIGHTGPGGLCWRACIKGRE